MKLIAQGAEAKILLNKNTITKDRVKKGYRIPELDNKIRKARTKAETKLLIKASKIINAPLPQENKEFDKIKIPYIKGDKLSTNLDNYNLKKQLTIMKSIGKDIATLHDNSIIHGDLTTSNMILVKDKGIRRDSKLKRKFDKENLGCLYFIDFGLGSISIKPEDKAVDLHLLKQALEAKHFSNYEKLWKAIESGYKNSKNSKRVLERLKTVEQRGRYKGKH